MKPARALATSARVTHPSTWSFTRPIACMNANAVVGPTKRHPRFYRPFDSATAAGEVVRVCGSPSSASGGS